MIELRDFLKIFIRHKFFVLTGLLIGIIFGGFLAWQEKQWVENILVLSLYREDNPEFIGSEVAKYDGYYIVETSRLYGERLGDYLASPSAKSLLRRKSIAAVFDGVLRRSSQDFEITLRAKEPSAMQAAAEEIVKGADSYLRDLSQESGEMFLFRVMASDAFGREPRWQILVIFGGLAGFLLGAAGAFMKEYITPANRRET